MATLADSFLQDLDDLEDTTDPTDGIEFDAIRKQNADVAEDNEDDPIPDAIELYENAEVDRGCVVSNLINDVAFNHVLERVRTITSHYKGKDFEDTYNVDGEAVLVENCNRMVITVDVDILNVHKFIRDIYSKKFPELESIIYSPLEYITIVRRVGNETDFTKVDLSDLLPNSDIMAVTVAASMTTGSALPRVEMEKVMLAADEALNLAECRKDILLYLESRMTTLAPNLSNLLGSALTARLITRAGSLRNLARMPAQNIMLIGCCKKSSLGMGSATAVPSMGLILSSEIIQQTPPVLRKRALKLVSCKCALAARVDDFKEATDGRVGSQLRQQIFQSLTKEQEPPPAPIKKSLPKPDFKPTARRAGRRFRRMKEKYGLTELQKLRNRVYLSVDTAEEEYGLESGKGMGMVGKSTGKGKIRLQAKVQKVKMPKKRQIQMSSGATNGMSSSLAFTPIQGIELCNPDAVRSKSQQKNKTNYFNNNNQFIMVEKTKTAADKVDT